MPDTHRSRIRDEAVPLTGPDSLDPLLDRIGDAHYVLLGEASHGTADYHQVRDLLTRRLIEEKGFSFVAVEGDWPDCQAVHRSLVAAPGAPEDPGQVLAGLRRWPAWMWGNTDVAAFARWLRRHNEQRPPGRRVGFFGLDVYSLWESLHAVLGHLREHDPDQVEPALEAYRCLEPYAEDPHSYALATRLVPEGCEPQVLSLLTELRRRAARTDATAGSFTEFAARQNAEILAGAEAYYRAVLDGGPESWNIRDHHMADTLDRLMAQHGPGAKAVVWAHNTHIGDARATDMADTGMVSIGQLVRERHMGQGVVLVGFGSFTGTVVAAHAWGDVPRTMEVPHARTGSLEDLLHDALPGARALFVFPHVQLQRPATTGSPAWFHQEHGHRAIGVVYRPSYEHVTNYVPTVLAQRYDAFCHLDRTRAVTPLHPMSAPTAEEQTWPVGV
ncbi:erythromycin esterase family protein [Streptomyces ferrugineus]|uniref:erythromycin esterase family protein n=1 Tax=Streptomyces ferrugineus TaxID=1413221 RepID=UPI001D14AB3C|nr:erythromycin esterase family protein [Streptomyces ferrugineus]